MKRFQKTEKWLIALVDKNKYNTYICNLHGVFQNRIDTDNKLCPFCKSEGIKLDIDELQDKFKKELKLE